MPEDPASSEDVYRLRAPASLQGGRRHFLCCKASASSSSSTGLGLCQDPVAICRKEEHLPSVHAGMNCSPLLPLQSLLHRCPVLGLQRKKNTIFNLLAVIVLCECVQLKGNVHLLAQPSDRPFALMLKWEMRAMPPLGSCCPEEAVVTACCALLLLPEEQPTPSWNSC